MNNNHQEDLFQIFFAASPLIMNIWDENINLVSTSPQSVKMFGLESQEQYLERFGELSPEVQPCGTPSFEKASNYVKQAFKNGSVKFEWMHQTLEKEPVPSEITIVRFTRQGKNYAAAYTVDLRPTVAAMERQKELEIQLRQERLRAAEESSEAKSKFLARMSHEIRTPITGVLGISEIQLQNRNLPLQTEEAFVKIHNSAQLLLGIINDVLDLSKIESGKMELMLREYDVAGMIGNVSYLYLAYLGDKDIKFGINIDENLPTLLIGESVRIEQVLNNLLSNAFKYTEKGEVNISFECEPSTESGYINMIVKITDTGLGMTEQQLASIFNEYERFHEEAAHIISGTGLGMPIVNNLVQLMNAEINITSEVGKGTQVILSMPQKIVGEETLGIETVNSIVNFEANVQKSHKYDIAAEPMPYGSVLVVDDVDTNLYVAKGLLEFYELTVETCSSGFEAIEKVKNGKTYDIIFMDHMMPELNGVETFNIIRDLGYIGAIVILTANAMIGKSDEFMAAGFDAFISKPIQTKHLNTVLHKFIKDTKPSEMIEAAHRDRAKRAINIGDFRNDASMQETLRNSFIAKQSDAFIKITDALKIGDIPNAHLLVHTLKGLAGLINENKLADISRKAESALEKGNKPDGEDLQLLNEELQNVLSRISTMQNKANNLEEFFNELKRLLQHRNAKCLELVDKLNTIPEAKILIRQINKFDFAGALKNLELLREVI